MALRALTVLGTALGLLVACAKAPAPSPPPPPVAPSQRLEAQLAWPYWQAPLVLLRAGAEPPPEKPEDSPPPAWLASDAVWQRASTAILAKVHEDGLAVNRTPYGETSIGAFYADRARRGAPVLITADSLFAIAHLAIASVAADVEERVMRGALVNVLHRLDLRLAAEVKRARPDLLEGYRIARTTVAVALALSDTTYVVPADLTEAVASERALVRAAAGVSRSPLFGVALDYGLMAPRGVLSKADPRGSMLQTAEWLGNAPFLFDGEGDGAKIDVGTARGQSRAALLLARLLRKGGDEVAAPGTARVSEIDRFWLGDTGDLSPPEVADLAVTSGIDLGGGSDIASTVKLDHFRHAGIGRSMRLIPLRAPPDDRVLRNLVSPFVGARAVADSGANDLPAERRIPSALDVGAWMGSATAAAALATRGDGTYAGFDGALSKLRAERPKDEALLHASVYASLLEAMATWLRPTAAEPARPASPRDAEGRRKLQTALVAWTFLRHDALPFAHEPARAPSALSPPAAGSNARPARVFVETDAEALASLLGAVQQLHRGLHVLGALTDDAPGMAVLAETESLLALALEASVRRANDGNAADLEPELARMPARIAALEAAARPAAEPVVIDVHADLAGGRVLEEATLPLEELFLSIHDPVSGHEILVVGAAIPHVEFVEPGFARMSDAEWRGRIAAGKIPDQGSLVQPEIVVSD